MSATNYVSTWMYVESAQEGGLYPQVGGLTTSQATQNIYWRCVYTFFWSANVFLKKDGLKFLLFTNVSRLPVVDGIDLNKALADFGVELVTLRYTWAPAGTRRPWFNQYFLFDILDYAADRLSDDDTLFVMDNDCLIVGDLAPAFALARHDGAALITVDVSEDEDANGLSRRQAMDVYAEVGGERPASPPDYFGGEFYGVSGAHAEASSALGQRGADQERCAGGGGQSLFLRRGAFLQLSRLAAGAQGAQRQPYRPAHLDDVEAQQYAERGFEPAGLASAVGEDLRLCRPFCPAGGRRQYFFRRSGTDQNPARRA